MRDKFTIRNYLGALLYDVPRAIKTSGKTNLRQGRVPWLYMRNRDQSLITDPQGFGVKCDWQWTAELYLQKVFPVYGRWLYRRALMDFPVSFHDQLKTMAETKPQVSFIIGHRGMDRLPLLLTTLKSIAGQIGCAVECIVVEQDNTELVRDNLPGWVRYIHTPLPDSGMPYSRAWAFNVGAQAARSECLVFHDNDMLVPSCYARDALKYHRMDYVFTNLKRFIFYLDKESSNKAIEKGSLNLKPLIESVVQNLEAGGSFVADKRAYYEIGGFDERFVGWGGEDNEFWERASTRRICPYGYLPFVHLWHAPQPAKHERAQAGGIRLYRQLSKQSPEVRIEKLRTSR